MLGIIKRLNNYILRLKHSSRAPTSKTFIGLYWLCKYFSGTRIFERGAAIKKTTSLFLQRFQFPVFFLKIKQKAIFSIER